MKLYVGNVPHKYSEQDLEQLFAPYGTLKSCKLVIDRETGRSRGFGFVEYELKAEGEQAMEALNGKDCDGRNLVVNEARPQERRPNNGGGGRPAFKRRF